MAATGRAAQLEPERAAGGSLKIDIELAFGNEIKLRAGVGESLQTFFFSFAEVESQIFPVIAATKFGIEFGLLRDQLVDLAEIRVA